MWRLIPRIQWSLRERDLTELQRRFLAASGDPIEFITTFPRLPIENFPLEVSKHRPDVWHVSAHGEGADLNLANDAGGSVPLSGHVLRAYLDIDRPPRLVYLNACTSRNHRRVVGEVTPQTKRVAERGSATAPSRALFACSCGPTQRF